MNNGLLRLLMTLQHSRGNPSLSRPLTAEAMRSKQGAGDWHKTEFIYAHKKERGGPEL